MRNFLTSWSLSMDRVHLPVTCRATTQPEITCSKLTIGALEQGVKICSKLTPCSIVCFVNFEQVNIVWVRKDPLLFLTCKFSGDPVPPFINLGSMKCWFDHKGTDQFWTETPNLVVQSSNHSVIKAGPRTFQNVGFICLNESPLYAMKNVFCFTLKTHFVLEIFKC